MQRTITALVLKIPILPIDTGPFIFEITLIIFNLRY